MSGPASEAGDFVLGVVGPRVQSLAGIGGSGMSSLVACKPKALHSGPYTLGRKPDTSSQRPHHLNT